MPSFFLTQMCARTMAGLLSDVAEAILAGDTSSHVLPQVRAPAGRGVPVLSVVRDPDPARGGGSQAEGVEVVLGHSGRAGRSSAVGPAGELLPGGVRTGERRRDREGAARPREV